MRFIKDINNSNFFLTGAATKGLQAPGIRIGWVVSSKRNIEILGNFSSIGMGGVSRLSQLYTLKLLDPKRVEVARSAVPVFYSKQRIRYKNAFNDLNLETFQEREVFIIGVNFQIKYPLQLSMINYFNMVPLF